MTETKDVAKTDGSVITTYNSSSLFNDEQLAGIASFKDAGAALDAYGVAAESASDYGTGFKVVEKDTLVGIPFVILEWRFSLGDFGDFVSCLAVTKHDEKVIFNDGSTGVRAQLETVTRQRTERKHPHPQAGLMVEKGLTSTTYYFNEKTKETKSRLTDADNPADWKTAHTYYLAD